MTSEPCVAIPLTKGKVAIIDAADYAIISEYKWCAIPQRSLFYACTEIKGRRIRMHRMLLDAGPGQMIDHIDGDGLNNRRSNLRFSDYTLNNANVAGRSKHGVKGVSFNPLAASKPWRAQLSIRGKRISSHYFTTKEEAADAYQKLAAKMHGGSIRIDMQDDPK